MCTTWVLVLKNIWPTQRVILPKPAIRLSLIIYASIVNTNKNWCATRLGAVCDSLRRVAGHPAGGASSDSSGALFRF